MADPGKSDNKLYQIIMVLITTIVAPVSVYFLTHSFDGSSKTATLMPTSAITNSVDGVSITTTPNQPQTTATIQPTPTAEASQPTPTAEVSQPTQPAVTTLPGEQNPQGILPAGETGIVNNFAVQVLTKEVSARDGSVIVKIHVRNLSEQPQTFTYQRQSIAIKDDNEHTLDVVYGEKKEACSRKDLSADQKITLAPNQEIVLHSVDSKTSWCKDDDTLLLPQYKVTAKDAPKFITVQFFEFGPFDNFGYKIEF